GIASVPSGLRLDLAAAVRQHGHDAGDVAPHLAHPRSVLELAAGALEAQVELLLAQAFELGLEFVRGLGADIGGLHRQPPSPRRVTSRVLIGSFAAASVNASWATFHGTPSISNMIRPG